jgi:hypothetical protein
MKRQHPLFSTLGITLTAILLVGLGAVLWRSGGKAFSPGRLSAQGRAGVTIGGFSSHAEFERYCSYCHAPLETTMDVLCLECHVNVADQVSSGDGSHGSIEQVNLCMDCHADHRGEQFDMLASAFDKFDHSGTGFSLVRHQLDYDTGLIECYDCHLSAEQFETSLESCAGCHGAHAPDFIRAHQQDFGSDCLVCHDGQDRMTDFDHAATLFPLEGKHAALSCAACHSIEMRNTFLSAPGAPGAEQGQGDLFQGTPGECSLCHREPDLHAGLFPDDCAACHRTAAWTPAVWDSQTFNHDQGTRFSLVLHALDYDGRPITCSDCHQGNFRDSGSQACVSCHIRGERTAGFMDEHLAQFGTGCLDCHDGIDRMSGFDHARVFVLDGAHSTIDCQACHIDYKFTGLSGECVDCHAEPEIHLGFFGLACQNCHSTVAWVPASLRFHDFPLDHGGEGQVPCETCHNQTYLEYTCYGCHEHQQADIQEEHIEEGISLSELKDCVECHPTGIKDED